MRTPLLLVTLIAAVPACTARAVSYRFAGPLVSAVSLDDVAEHGGQRRRYDDGVVAPEGAALARRIVDVPGGGLGDGAAVHPGPRATITRAELAVFPEPHRQPKADAGDAVLDLGGRADVATLRALIGSRDGRGDVGFALDAATLLRGAPAHALPASLDGPALVELAQARGALDAPDVATAPAPGDLLVFDRVVDGEPASLVAVVLDRDGRGVIEMLYLARGVVRRGFVDPTRPTVKRDVDGRVVNTLLRHGSNAPPKGTHYLAGELLASRIRWRQLGE